MRQQSQLAFIYKVILVVSPPKDWLAPQLAGGEVAQFNRKEVAVYDG